MAKVEYVDYLPPWDEGQKKTLRLFENLGVKFGGLFLQLHGPDKADGEAILGLEAGKQIENAIKEGRRSWLPRRFELDALGKTIKRAHVNQVPLEFLDQAVNESIKNYFVDVGEGIEEFRPY